MDEKESSATVQLKNTLRGLTLHPLPLDDSASIQEVFVLAKVRQFDGALAWRSSADAGEEVPSREMLVELEFMLKEMLAELAGNWEEK